MAREMTEAHKRWRIPFIGRGAHSQTGGHCYVLGVMVAWLPVEAWRPSGILEIDLFRVLAFRREGGWQWSLAKIEFKHAFRPARWRFGERERNAARRASRRRFQAILDKMSKQPATRP